MTQRYNGKPANTIRVLHASDKAGRFNAAANVGCFNAGASPKG